MRREAERFAQAYKRHPATSVFAQLWASVQAPVTKMPPPNADGDMLHALYERLGIDSPICFRSTPPEVNEV